MQCVVLSHLFWTSDYTFRYNMWMHQLGLHRQEEGCKIDSPFAVLALNVLSREGFSRPFPSSTVRSSLCAHDRTVLQLMDMIELDSPSKDDTCCLHYSAGRSKRGGGLDG